MSISAWVCYKLNTSSPTWMFWNVPFPSFVSGHDRNVIRSMDRGIQAAQSTMQYVVLYLIPTLVEALAVVASAEAFERWDFEDLSWDLEQAQVSLIFVFHFKNLQLAVPLPRIKNYHIHDSVVLQLHHESQHSSEAHLSVRRSMIYW